MNKRNQKSAAALTANRLDAPEFDVSVCDFQTALSSTNSITYRMRTECALDADLALNVLGRWVLGWSQQYACVNKAGAVGFPDVDVELNLRTSAPPVESLRWLLSKVVDLHLAAESLDYADKYTGDRIDYSCVEAGRPDDAVIADAIEAMERNRHLLELQSSAINQCIDALREEKRTSSKQARAHRPTNKSRGRKQGAA